MTDVKYPHVKVKLVGRDGIALPSWDVYNRP